MEGSFDFPIFLWEMHFFEKMHLEPVFIYLNYPEWSDLYLKQNFFFPFLFNCTTGSTLLLHDLKFDDAMPKRPEDHDAVKHSVLSLKNIEYKRLNLT